MRIGIDAMGGDRHPSDEVRGALAARKLLGDGDSIVLIGDEQAIKAELDRAGEGGDGIEVVHAEQAIGPDEPPVEALRSKPRSSISIMVQMQAEGQLDAGISAGNTGACVAAAQMRLRRLTGVHRPGIAIVTPTAHGPVTICDVGANVACRPQHLHQYALMSSIYARSICGVQNPRVGLLSIGEEDAKGNSLVRGARELMDADHKVNFVGNVEGRDLFRGVCDVVVCDGFVGNVVLKLMEGMAQSVVRTLIEEMIAGMPDQAAGIKKAAASMMARFDFNEYGGAPLLGVAGISIICHGASDGRGFMNAVRVAADFSKRGVNQQITELLSPCQGTVHG